MINKEEIEKAKEFIKFYRQHCLNIENKNMDNYETVNDEEFVSWNLGIVLQYILELESDNYEQNSIINNYIEIEKEHQKLVGELTERIKELEEIKKEFDRRSNLSNAQLLKRGYISKDKIREIVELYDNSKKELVILPNKQVCCLSDSEELIEYLRELLKEAED